MIFLAGLLFVLILGPVLDVGLGQLGDVSFICSVMLVLHAVIFTRIALPRYIMIALGLIVAIFFLALINTLLLDPFEIDVGVRAIFRPFRIFFVILSCYYCLVIINNSFISRNISSEDRFVKLVEIIYYILVAHALLMCFQFVFPDFRDFFYQFTFAKDQLEYNKMFRMAGLTGAGGAQTSFVQGLGCLLGWFLLFFRNYSAKYLVIIGNILLITSIILSGRTGLIVVVLGFLLFSMLKILLLFTQRQKKIKGNPLYICIIMVPFFVVDYLPDYLGDNYNFLETAFNRTFKTFSDYSETGSLQDDTLIALADMVILPDETSHLLLGKSSYLEGNTYYSIFTDIGYFRLIWGYGLFGLLIHVAFYFLLLYKVLSIKRSNMNDLYFKCLPLSIICFVFLMNSKEIFFMTRISFHITLVIVFFYVMQANRSHNVLK